MLYTSRSSIIKKGSESFLQDKEYREWSRQKGNIYALRINKNVSSNTENIFVDGQGFKKSTVEKKAVITFKNVICLAAFIFILSLFIGNLFPMLMAQIWNIFSEDKLDIHFFSGYITLRSMVSYIIMVSSYILKYALGIIVMYLSLKMPKNLSGIKIPYGKGKDIFKITGLVLILASIMLGFTVSFRSQAMLGYLGASFVDNAGFFKENIYIKMVVIIFWILMQSIMMSLFFESTLFFALRQYGDYFAIIFTSSMSMLMTQNIFSGIISFCVSFIAGIAVSKTKSVYIAILERFIISFLAAIAYTMSNSFNKVFSSSVYIFIAFIFVIGFIILISSGFFENMKQFFTAERKNIFTQKTMLFLYTESMLSVSIFLFGVILFVIGCVVSGYSGT